MENRHPLWENLFKQASEKQADIASLWMDTPLFSGISQRHIRAITKNLSVRHYEPGEAVFNAGEVGVGAALVINGSITIQSSGQILATLVRGDFFGEVALAMDEARTADAVAKEPAELVFFMKQDLEDIVNQTPAIAAKFAINLARVLAVRLRHTNTQKEVEAE